jgi:hypothetical protein
MTRGFGALLRGATTGHLAALSVALAPLVYFLPAATGRLVLCPDDGLVFNLPLRAAAAEIVRAGSLPLWNPYVFGGMPLLGAAQGGVLFPLNWFFLLFSPQLAMNLAVLSAYSLAGLGAYVYARRTAATVTGALVTALAWQWGGFLVAQVGHTNVVHAASLLPWLLWAVERYAEAGRRAWGCAVAVVVALMAFAGHQQMLAYSLLLASAYALYMWRATARRAYLWSLAFVAAGLALAAVQLLPTLELVRHSVRAEADYEFFSSFSMPPQFLLNLFAPYVTGGGFGPVFRAPYTGTAFYAEYIGYVGVSAVALALAAPLLARGRRDPATVFWAAAALAALALAAGRHWPFDLYRLVHQLPVINLFRVPARHLLEADFALAVLAGRAVTALAAATHDRAARRRATLITTACAAAVFALTCLAVTAWRPADFEFGRRVVRASVLRAPELFLPIIVAGLSVFVLWRLARARRGAGALLVALVAFDLCLWGQSSGWRERSPGWGHEVWRAPAPVEHLRADARGRGEPSRVLTLAAHFRPGEADAVARPASGSFVLGVQPNFYMMSGVENAAGYDGFGLARQSRLAGNMKLWGELTDPDRALGAGRELDILNVRHVVALAPGESAGARPSAGPPTVRLGEHLFAESELGVPTLERGARLRLLTPRLAATHLALVTNLSWSASVPTGAVVARIRLTTDDGRSFELPLRAGLDTSEWAHDRPDVRASAAHKRAPVATSYKVEDAGGDYEGHTYVTALALPERATVTGGSIEVSVVEGSPQLGLSVQRASLFDAQTGETVPLRRERFARVAAAAGDEPAGARPDSRWRRAAELEDVWLYENTRALPRAWLATEIVELPGDALLEVIRTGLLPDGREWEPRRAALVEESPGVTLGGEEVERQARVTRHEPNRVEVRTSAPVPSVLVLSENHYPGWRAFVDGRGVETMRVDYNLRGVLLAPGEHEVQFLYRPKSVLLGLLVSLLAACALAAWAAGRLDVLLTRKRQQPGRQTAP